MTGTGAKPRVLLVEDETLIAIDLRSTLKQAGWEVVGPVATVTRAVSAAVTEELDAALLDVNLLNGLSLPAAELLAARGVPVVFLTTYAELPLPSSLAGAPVLRKPCHPRRVLAALETAGLTKGQP